MITMPIADHPSGAAHGFATASRPEAFNGSCVQVIGQEIATADTNRYRQYSTHP
jgi:hypothetical protein